MILKFIKPEINLNENLAIIGNSPSLLQKNFGEEIEKFKSVIRFNLAPIENFEKNVGSKTTAWFCAQNGAQIKAFREWLIFNNIKDQKLFDRNFMNLHNQKIIYCDVSGKNPLQLNIDYHESNRVYNFDYTSNLYLRYKYGLLSNVLDKSLPYGSWINLIFGQNLSAGLLFVLLCIESGIKPTLFGFDLNIVNNKSHYFLNEEKSKLKNFFLNHNYFYERILLKKLIKRKLIILKK